MITKDQIKQARQTDLVEYLQERGELLKQEGHDFRLVGNQGLMIRGNGYYCHSNPNGKLDGQPDKDGNNALSFVMYYYGMTFEEAVKELIGQNDGSGKERTIWRAVTGSPSAPSSLEVPTTQNIEYGTNQKRAIAYLCKKRMIDYNIVKSLIADGKLKQDIRGNACFIINDWHEEPIGAEIVGTGDTRYKRITVHSGYGFHLTIGTDPKIAMYFESAIDLLSCYQWYQNDLKCHILVSMGGLHDSVVQSLMQTKAGLRHYICCDNDDAGNKFVGTMKMQGCEEFRPYPNCKDWNEYVIGMAKVGRYKYGE